MTFEIYSIGDVDFLAEIINSVAMVTAVPSFQKMVSIGLLIGLLFVFIQSIFQGARQINWHQIFLGWLLYAMFFIPTTSVIILDSYSAKTRVIDNVPIGIGAAGGIISRIGYGITRIFEQGYGFIDFSMTQNRFADSLEVLNDVRRKGQDARLFKAMNDARPGADMRMSWYNYIKECAITKISTKDITLEDFYAQPMQQALDFQTYIYHTEIKTTGGAPQTLLCHAAFAQLKAATADAMNSPQFSAALERVLGAATVGTGITPPVRIQGALQSMNAIQSVGASTDAAHDYVLTSMLEPVYTQAASGFYRDMQDVSSAMMVNQALAQRNTQWAAEQTMFMSVVRPMVTFFEAFIYAITPIMGFLLVIGGLGMSLAGKYFLVLFWIQLWMPVLSIVNLFINTVAAGRIGQLNSDGYGLTSMYALSTGSDILQNWIATGGMLAAATPIISLFIVTGSTYAFTSLAGRINGADHINEKISSPDAVEPAPVMKQMPHSTQDPMRGTLRTGGESLDTHYRAGDALNAAERSTQRNMVQDSQNFAETLQNSITQGASKEEIAANMQGLSTLLASSNNKEITTAMQEADKVLQSSGLSTTQKNAVGESVRTAVTMSAAAGGKLPFSLFSASIEASLTAAGESMNQHEVRDLYDRTVQAGKDLNLNDTQRASLNNAMSQDITSSRGNNFRDSIGYGDDHALAKSSSRLEASSKAWEQATARTRGMDSSLAFSGSQIAGQMQGNDTRKLHNWVQNQDSGLQQKIHSNAARFSRSDHMNLTPEMAYKKAAFDALHNKAVDGDTGSAELLGSLYQSVFGQGTPDVGNYQKGRDLPQVNHGGLIPKVNKATERAANLDNSGRASVVAQANAPQVDKTNKIMEHHNNAAQGVQSEHAGRQQVMYQTELQNQRHALSASVEQGLSLTGLTKGAYNNFTHGLNAALNDFYSGASFGNIGEEDQEKFRASIEANGWRKWQDSQRDYEKQAKSLGMSDDMAHAAALVRGGDKLAAHNHLASTVFANYAQYDDEGKHHPKIDGSGRIIVQGQYGQDLRTLLAEFGIADRAGPDMARAHLSAAAKYEQVFNKMHRR